MAKTKKKWSAEVTENSDAMDQPNVIESDDPEKIALSLKRSGFFQSAMSMRNFYINRAGKNLPKRPNQVLEDAKNKLREAFRRKPERYRSTGSFRSS